MNPFAVNRHETNFDDQIALGDTNTATDVDGHTTDNDYETYIAVRN